MAISGPSMLEVKWTRDKGRGVFAREFIPQGTVFERAPVLVLPASEILDVEEPSALYAYVFEWRKDKVALALGFGSLYNHSYSPNARYDDAGRQLKLFSALRDIQPGEEITINYNGAEDILDPVGFDVVENE